MDKDIRPLVNFFELSSEWQAEAISNLGEDAEDATYIEPLEHHVPKDHVLWDLSECMRTSDSEYDGVIGISNNSALAIKLIGDEQAELIFL